MAVVIIDYAPVWDCKASVDGSSAIMGTVLCPSIFDESLHETGIVRAHEPIQMPGFPADLFFTSVRHHIGPGLNTPAARYHDGLTPASIQASFETIENIELARGDVTVESPACLFSGAANQSGIFGPADPTGDISRQAGMQPMGAPADNGFHNGGDL
jgi:hypothetical protein